MQLLQNAPPIRRAALANQVLTLLSWALDLSRSGDGVPRDPIRAGTKAIRGSALGLVLVGVGGKATWGVLRLFESERATYPFATAAIRLLILTGCRSAEILGLRWEHVGRERRCLHLPDSKTGQRTVFLNAPAAELLAELEPVPGSPHVIPGAEPGSHRRDNSSGASNSSGSGHARPPASRT